MNRELTDMILCRNVSEVLERHYPGWCWLVGVEQGMVRIHSFKLSTLEGYRLRPEEIDNDYRRVVDAGGEILERFGMPRGRYNHEAWLSAPWKVGRRGYGIQHDSTKTGLARIYI